LNFLFWINLLNHLRIIKARVPNSFGYIRFLWILLYFTWWQQHAIFETFSLTIDITVDRSRREIILRREKRKQTKWQRALKRIFWYYSNWILECFLVMLKKTSYFRQVFSKHTTWYTDFGLVEFWKVRIFLFWSNWSSI